MILGQAVPVDYDVGEARKLPLICSAARHRIKNKADEYVGVFCLWLAILVNICCHCVNGVQIQTMVVLVEICKSSTSASGL